jgi:signal peptidase I
MAHISGRDNQEGFWATTREIVVILLVIFLIRTFGFGLYQVPTGSMETTMLVGERFFADKFTPLFRPIQRGDIIALNSPTFHYSENPIKNWWQMYVWGPENWTKRVIGIPGDTIKGVVQDGKPVIYLNGKKLEEPYLNKYPLIAVRTRPCSFFSHGDEIKKSYDPAASYQGQPFYRIDPRCIVKDINGKPFLLEPHVGISSPRMGVVGSMPAGNYWDGSDEFSVELGKNQYWLMGDNRRGSSDSRYIGPVNGKLIHGKIVFRILSIDTDDSAGRPDASWLSWFKSFLFVDMVLHPIDFWSRVRWSRMFQPVR